MEGRLRILVVDRAEDVRGSLATFLATLPRTTVHTTANAEDALDKARSAGPSRAYDLVIAHARLGDMDGLRLLTLLDDEGLARRAILMSGDARARGRLARSGRPYAFLAKPVDPHRIDALAREALTDGRPRFRSMPVPLQHTCAFCERHESLHGPDGVCMGRRET